VKDSGPFPTFCGEVLEQFFVGLPVMDGHRFFHLLRERKLTPEKFPLSVLVLTTSVPIQADLPHNQGLGMR
jgi:hypothetical protein